MIVIGMDLILIDIPPWPHTPGGWLLLISFPFPSTLFFFFFWGGGGGWGGYFFIFFLFSNLGSFVFSSLFHFTKWSNITVGWTCLLTILS